MTSITSRLRRLAPQPSLEQIFERNEGRLIHKWMHYLEIYERHFQPFRGEAPRILEIGVSHGGSLDMWHEWFGPGTHVVGVDIDPRCTSLAGPGVDIRIGDQGDPDFLRQLSELGPFDVIIDDGSHFSRHQIASLEALWTAVKVGGVYLVEDLHANYWTEYDGGLRHPDTFVEYVKRLIDDLHGFHTNSPWSPAVGLEPTNWTRTLGGMHFYDSVVVLDRVDRTEPVNRKSGRPAFDTLYGKDAISQLEPEHVARIAEMNRPTRRAMRALRSPITTTRRLIDRWRAA